jgi:hypothetical protein
MRRREFITLIGGADNSRAAGVRLNRSFQANPLLVAHFVAPGVAPE